MNHRIGRKCRGGTHANMSVKTAVTAYFMD